jgi:hypothetical protein
MFAVAYVLTMWTKVDVSQFTWLKISVGYEKDWNPNKWIRGCVFGRACTGLEIQQQSDYYGKMEIPPDIQTFHISNSRAVLLGVEWY